MKYELTIETKTCDSILNFPHTREGLESALKKIGDVRFKSDFQSAQIVSDRDGVIFNLNNNIVTV